MSGSIGVGSARGQGVSLYEVAYRGGVLAMDILEPDASLAEFEASLTADALLSLLEGVRPPSQTSVLLPKFSFATRVPLTPVLVAMGMTDVFDSTKADLSGVDGRTDLHVGLAVHQALVEVDEAKAPSPRPRPSPVKRTFSPRSRPRSIDRSSF